MMNIAIVDDDKKAANALADKLSAYEGVHICGIALNGMDGLNLMNDKHPDVLFLDIELPDISGIEFLERVHCYPHGSCRVVMYTAHDRFMLSAFRNMAYDYLMKPIEDADLRSIIRRICIERSNPHFSSMKSEVASNHNNDFVDDKPAVADAQGDRQRDVSEDSSAGDLTESIACRNDGKFIVYTNTVDFRLVDIREIGIFSYNHDLRIWEMVISSQPNPIRLKRNVNSDVITELNSQFVRVSQKHIINLGYLMEVVNNTCRFYPPFDKIEDVKVGRFFRKKLIEQFSSF